MCRKYNRHLSSTLRSPDVILGLPITAAVDMWSLGGVLATMYLGTLPFPQRCQYYLVCNLIYLDLIAQLHVETYTWVLFWLMQFYALFLCPDEKDRGDSGSAGG